MQDITENPCKLIDIDDSTMAERIAATLSKELPKELEKQYNKRRFFPKFFKLKGSITRRFQCPI